MAGLFPGYLPGVVAGRGRRAAEIIFDLGRRQRAAGGRAGDLDQRHPGAAAIGAPCRRTRRK